MLAQHLPGSLRWYHSLQLAALRLAISLARSASRARIWTECHLRPVRKYLWLPAAAWLAGMLAGWAIVVR